MDILLTAVLLIGFVYVFLLATNPRGAWDCPVCRVFTRIFRPQPRLVSRRDR